MNFQKSLTEAWEILQLKQPTMQKVAADGKATQAAWVFVGIGALASSLGMVFFPEHVGRVVYRPDTLWVLTQAIVESVIALVALYLGGALAQRLFGSTLSTASFVRVMGHAMVLGIVNLIPALGFLCLWELVVLYRVCTRLGGMKPGMTVLFMVCLALVVILLSGLVY